MGYTCEPLPKSIKPCFCAIQAESGSLTFETGICSETRNDLESSDPATYSGMTTNTYHSATDPSSWNTRAMGRVPEKGYFARAASFSSNPRPVVANDQRFAWVSTQSFSNLLFEPRPGSHPLGARSVRDLRAFSLGAKRAALFGRLCGLLAGLGFILRRRGLCRLLRGGTPSLMRLLPAHWWRRVRQRWRAHVKSTPSAPTASYGEHSPACSKGRSSRSAGWCHRSRGRIESGLEH